MQNLQAILETLHEGPRKFSEIKEKTGLENGVIQHHINSSDQISHEKDVLMLKGECTRCDLKGVCEERCAASLLNDEEKRRILKLVHEDFSQREIAEAIDKNPSTVNYHIDRLREFNLIENRSIKEEVLRRLEL